MAVNQGIDFSPIVSDLSPQVESAVLQILESDLAPGVKISRISRLLKNTGSHFYGTTYDATSEIFDSAAMRGNLASLNDQADRLANKILQDYALSRDNLGANMESFFNSLLGQSQQDAFNNANSMQRHPVLTRSIVGETCAWCDAMSGTHINPTGDQFARHRDCDCLFEVSGYNSRNGVINNFAKVK